MFSLDDQLLFSPVTTSFFVDFGGQFLCCNVHRSSDFVQRFASLFHIMTRRSQPRSARIGLDNNPLIAALFSVGATTRIQN